MSHEPSSTTASASVIAGFERAVDDRVLATLPSGHRVPELAEYYRLLREYPLRGGKRLRARLTLLSTAMHGAGWRTGLTAAAAIELFQNWVLVHDDIEDDSDERRGLPTLHREIGKPVAINVGDGLHAYMWQLLLGDRELPREALDEFSWMIHRTAEGQHLDLSWVRDGRLDIREEEYLEMVRLKTACYTVTSPLRLGAICAGRPPDPRLAHAGDELGVAFQIRDDVLNLTPGAPSGKEFAGDLYEGKRTLILAHFFASAGPSDVQQMVDLLAGPRSERSGDQVATLLRLMGRYGSVAYAQRQAVERATRGMELLADVLAGARDQTAAGELRRLMGTLAHRDR